MTPEEKKIRNKRQVYAATSGISTNPDVDLLLAEIDALRQQLAEAYAELVLKTEECLNKEGEFRDIHKDWEQQEAEIVRLREELGKIMDLPRIFNPVEAAYQAVEKAREALAPAVPVEKEDRP